MVVAQIKRSDGMVLSEIERVDLKWVLCLQSDEMEKMESCEDGLNLRVQPVATLEEMGFEKNGRVEG